MEYGHKAIKCVRITTYNLLLWLLADSLPALCEPQMEKQILLNSQMLDGTTRIQYGIQYFNSIKM